MRRSVITVGRILKNLVILCAGTSLAHAQWLNYRTAGTPRTADGKPNLTAKAPRAHGKPDLSGVWQSESPPPGENERRYGEDIARLAVPGDDERVYNRYAFNLMADFKPEESPLRPEVAERMRKERAAGIRSLPACHPMGLPLADLFNFAPFKMIQTPGVIAVLYEADETFRQIYTDGRKLPVDPQPSWLGYSVGNWEGDTLVVDVAGFNDRARLDLVGHPHSEEIRIKERFHRRDFGHMDLTSVVDDPKTFTRPVTVNVTELLVPDSDVLESICNENEKDSEHIGKR